MVDIETFDPKSMINQSNSMYREEKTLNPDSEEAEVRKQLLINDHCCVWTIKSSSWLNRTLISDRNTCFNNRRVQIKFCVFEWSPAERQEAGAGNRGSWRTSGQSGGGRSQTGPPQNQLVRRSLSQTGFNHDEAECPNLYLSVVWSYSCRSTLQLEHSACSQQAWSPAGSGPAGGPSTSR